ncbi:MAG: GNAT family N-acetyltransferase [Mesorhizobium sp.]|nr:GNAT family N-acetyltransferase [Mesorhizobium sp.]MBL8578210.1 GNAT family N-acetyltransferase [Mesorhizobium sp.]
MTNGPHVAIRPAVDTDVEAIHSAVLAIAEAVGESHKVRSTPEDIRRFGFGQAPSFAVLIAEIDGRFAGCCLYFPSFSTWFGAPGAYVQDFYVRDEFRGQGIGERLLRRLAALTRESGGCYIRLSVDKQNRRAQAFYSRCGLRLSDSEQIHAARGEDFQMLADADEPDQVSR